MDRALVKVMDMIWYRNQHRQCLTSVNFAARRLCVKKKAIIATHMYSLNISQIVTAIFKSTCEKEKLMKIWVTCVNSGNLQKTCFDVVNEKLGQWNMCAK